MTSASTTRKRKPGVMNSRVSPAHGASVPPAAADSSARTAVVPTAITRPPAARQAATASHGLGRHLDALGVHRGARASSSTRTGWKVPAPTCSVTRAAPRRTARSAASSAASKCRPAGRRRHGAGRARVDGLVALAVERLGRRGDVGRQRHLAMRSKTRGGIGAELEQPEIVLAADHRGRGPARQVDQRRRAPVACSRAAAPARGGRRPPARAASRRGRRSPCGRAAAPGPRACR